MIYDTFLFFNEMELLDLRLHELANVVDRFVVVEANRTFTGLSKPLHFAENRHLFREFDERILHVAVEDRPGDDDPCDFADRQRIAISRALVNCRPDDVVLLSDLDEIPRPDKVRETVRKLRFDSRPAAVLWHRLLKTRAVIWTFRDLFKKRHPFVWVFDHRFFMYFLNCPREEHRRWLGTRLVHYRDFSSGRDLRRWGGRMVADGGWHFSYIGGVERIQSKLASFSHTELNTPEFNNRERIAKALQAGENIITPRSRLRFERIDESYPAYLRANLERFAPWIRPVPQ